MQNRITWKEIRNRITFDDRGKMDYIVPIEDVRMSTDTGVIYNRLLPFGDQNQLGASHNGLIPNDHALGQLFGRLGMDIKYFRRAYEKDPYLAAEHVNYWIETGDIPRGEVNDRSWLIRGKNDTMRAVLTDRYAQVDNHFAFDVLSGIIREDASVNLEGFHLDDKYLNIRMIFRDMKINIGTEQNPDYVFVGVHVVNSEVGCSSYRIESCLWRQVCSNGLIIRVDGEILLRQRHSGISREELERKVAEALAKAIRQGDKLIDIFARSREVKVEDPIEIIKNLSKQQKYSQQVTDTLINSFNSEPGNTAFHVVNAFTHAAQTLDMEKRLEMETFAGNWLLEAVAA